MTSACIGLVGGLGVGATLHYYRGLAAMFAERGTPLRLLVSHADIGVVSRLLEPSKAQELAVYLAGHLDALVRGGADFTSITAVAPHICVEQLDRLWQGERLDLLTAIRNEVRRRGLSRVAIFGSAAAMQSDLFGALTNVDVVRLSEADMAYVAQSYRNLAQTGDESAFDRERFREIADAVIKAHGVQSVLLAGTDLAVAIDETSAGFPAVDCTALHIRALYDRAVRPPAS